MMACDFQLRRPCLPPACLFTSLWLAGRVYLPFACRVILHNFGNKISNYHLKVGIIPGNYIEISF